MKVNSAAYQATLKKLKTVFLRKRPQISDKRVLLLHGNGRPYTAHATVNLLERRGWEILEHPPYSPDLASSDFHLFPNMKKIFFNILLSVHLAEISG
jgi:histone-lysine N-methyltransferase SETMAR